jgi:hypothetical protein
MNLTEAIALFPRQQGNWQPVRQVLRVTLDIPAASSSFSASLSLPVGREILIERASILCQTVSGTDFCNRLSIIGPIDPQNNFGIEQVLLNWDSGYNQNTPGQSAAHVQPGLYLPSTRNMHFTYEGEFNNNLIGVGLMLGALVFWDLGTGNPGVADAFP